MKSSAVPVNYHQWAKCTIHFGSEAFRSRQSRVLKPNWKTSDFICHQEFFSRKQITWTKNEHNIHYGNSASSSFVVKLWFKILRCGRQAWVSPNDLETYRYLIERPFDRTYRSSLEIKCPSTIRMCMMLTSIVGKRNFMNWATKCFPIGHIPRI